MIIDPVRFRWINNFDFSFVSTEPPTEPVFFVTAMTGRVCLQFWVKIKKVCVHTCDQSETLHACEVGMLNGHDPSLSEQLLWVVIDQLSVEEEEEQ